MNPYISIPNRTRIVGYFILFFFINTFAFTNCGRVFTVQDTGSKASFDPLSGAEKMVSCGPGSSYFPPEARLVTVGEKAQLQILLDTHKIVRLEVGDYGQRITLRSGQQLYGYPGRTKMASITIAPGTRAATLRGIFLESPLLFPPSEISTSENCFSLIQGGLTIDQATVEDNVFLSFFHADVMIDTSRAGAVRNNRFIRFQSHNSGFHSNRSPVTLIGDVGLKSTGNAFVFINALGPYRTPIEIKNQDEISLLGVDVEDYDTSPGTQALLTTRNVKKLHAMSLQGAVVQDALDIGAEEFVLYNPFFYMSNPGFTLRAENKRAAWFSHGNNLSASLNDENPAGTRVWSDWSQQVKPFVVNGGTGPTLSGFRAAEATAMLASPQGNSKPWGIPSGRSIADPVGPGWEIGLDARPDDAPALQALLDENADAVVHLEPRIYYIGSTLKMSGNQMIVGAGPGRTAIVAKNKNIHMFETNFKSDQLGGFVIMDLTLQGGRTGAHFSQEGVNHSDFYMSHVTFREMGEAGIFIDGTYGWDNGYTEYLDFYRTGTGFKQRGKNPMSGENPTAAYMDKVLFYRNQYVECDVGIDLLPARQNNLNFWFESSFRNNRLNAVRLSGYSSATHFVSSEFLDNGGHPSLQAAGGAIPTLVVNSKLRAGPALSLLSAGITCEGCVMSRGSSDRATVLNPQSEFYFDPRDHRRTYLFNNDFGDVPIGDVERSMHSIIFINNKTVAADSRWNIQMGMLAYETFGTPWLGDDVHVEPLRWLNDARVNPGTRLLRSGN